MPKPPGTPDGVGLVHMPKLTPAYAVTYEQVGGFGPVSRAEAFKAIKQAGNIGHIRPDTVWVQKGRAGADANLQHAITQARAQFRIVDELIKEGPKANEGWGVYYQFGRHIIVEHTSDTNSVVTKVSNGSKVTLPHFHIEVAPFGTTAATRSKAGTLSVARADRMGSASPLSPAKAKFNHHLYYLPLS